MNPSAPRSERTAAMNERLYTDLADWWPLLSPPEGQIERAELYRRVLLPQPSDALLELGSAAGLLALHLPDSHPVTLVDLSPTMVEVSRGYNPSRHHLVGDLRTLRIDRRYQAVLLHDAVMYMTTEADLRAAFETAFAHLEPGGRFLVVPDVYADGFEETVIAGGGSAPDGRGAQLMEWHWDPNPDDTTYQVEFSLLLRGPDGQVQNIHDQHTLGLFPRNTYARLLRDVGFELVQPDWEDAVELGEVFLCRKP